MRSGSDHRQVAYENMITQLGTLFKSEFSDADFPQNCSLMAEIDRVKMRYTNKTILGVGGMKQIYRVHDHMTDRAVATPVIDSAYEGSESRYHLPADFMKDIRFTNDGVYRISGRYLYVTGEWSGDFHYYGVPGESEFSPLFVKAAATLLASYLASALINSLDVKNALLRDLHNVVLPELRTFEAFNNSEYTEQFVDTFTAGF